MGPDEYKRVKLWLKANHTGAANAPKGYDFGQGRALHAPERFSRGLRSARVAQVHGGGDMPRVRGSSAIVQSYEHNTFTNSSQAEQWFAQRTLLPWIRKLEAVFNSTVIADPRFRGPERAAFSGTWISPWVRAAALEAAIKGGVW